MTKKIKNLIEITTFIWGGIVIEKEILPVVKKTLIQSKQAKNYPYIYIKKDNNIKTPKKQTNYELNYYEIFKKPKKQVFKKVELKYEFKYENFKKNPKYFLDYFTKGKTTWIWKFYVKIPKKIEYWTDNKNYNICKTAIKNPTKNNYLSCIYILKNDRKFLDEKKVVIML